MPHEATVDHEDSPMGPPDEGHLAFRTRDGEDDKTNVKKPKVTRGESLVPHLFAETPRHVTHHHDEDDSDEECGSGVSSGASSGASISSKNEDDSLVRDAIQAPQY